MGRLINADKLIDYFYYGQDDKPIIDGYADRKIIAIIKEQPTAYDIEKVVAELEVLHDLVNVNQKLAVSQAIEIVKRGGVE